MPLITAKLTAVFLVALVALSINVIRRRRAIHAALGEDDPILRRRIRAQGNFVEYVPMGLLALLLLELCGAAAWQIWSLGGLLVLGRLLHAIALLKAILPLRVAGMACTFTMLLLCAVSLLLM